jgi:hypothetical protein
MNEKMNMGLNLVPIADSIAGMIKVIESATLVNSGTIYQWTGKILEY